MRDNDKIIVKEQVRRRFSDSIADWYCENKRDFGWRRTTDPYRILVAELMLRRTRAEQVADVYNQFIALWPTPADFSSATSERVEAVLRPLGLNWRIQNFLALRSAIRNEVPNEYLSLLELPGVGDYVASAVVCLAFGEKKALIDTNSVRVIGRYFGVATGPETRRRKNFRELASSLVPERSKEYNLGIIDLAAKVCRPNTPDCASCTLAQGCAFRASITDGNG